MNNSFINDFLNYLKSQKRYSLNTIKSYEKDLILFFDHLTKEGIVTIDQITIQTYISSLYIKKNAISTIARKLSAIKSYAKYLSKYKDTNCDYIKNITLPKKEKKLPQHLHSDEINKLLNLPLNNILDMRNALIINLLYSSGLRLSELTNLKKEDFSSEQNIIRVKGKGNKERLVIYSNSSKKILDMYLKSRTDSSNYLLINKNGGKLTNRGVELILKTISKKHLGHDKLHPHMLRHTFATKLLNSGMDIRTLQELLGHESLAATQIYTHIAKNELKELYTTYHPRGDNDDL